MAQVPDRWLMNNPLAPRPVQTGDAPKTGAAVAPRAVRTVHCALVLLPGYLDAALGLTQSLLQTANALAAIGGRAARGPQTQFRLSLVTPWPQAAPAAPADVLLSGGGSELALGMPSSEFQAEAQREPEQAPHTGYVQSAAGMWLPVQGMSALFNPGNDPDIVLLPGVFLDSEAAMQQWLSQPWCAAWQHFASRLSTERARADRHIAASCAGTWALAEAGLLDGHEATTVWWLAPAFHQRYPKVKLMPQAMLVDSGSVTTAGAALAHTDLVLQLIARWGGATLAERCASVMLAERRDLQSRHLQLSWMAQSDPVIRDLHGWISRHLAEPIDVDDLARRAHLSPRTLARRCQQALGLSPWRMVQRARVEAAAELLKTTRLPFDSIAAKVGYDDAAALRKLIQRELGVLPKGLRGGAGL